MKKKSKVKTETVSLPVKSTEVTTVWPIKVDFFNDTGKPIHIRSTAFTHPDNPETIAPLHLEKLYIKCGFMKLWDHGGYFQLLVE